MSDICRICTNAVGNQAYQVREMQFGTREVFRYFQCAKCGCLQISEIPQDIDRHYPQNYYSFRRYDKLARSGLRAWFDSRRVKYALTGKGFVGKLAAMVARPMDYVHWMKEAGFNTDATILDIGCGQGKLLLRMKLGGFSRSLGVDLFVPSDIHYSNGVTVLKRQLDDFAKETNQVFDVVMMHHSLEHMENPQAMLSLAASLLAPKGCLLVRIPVADSYSWEYYRENWAHLDAPRHFYLHTRRSMEVLAAQSGLKVRKVEWDSNAQQFIGSELFQRDIPLNTDRCRELFSKKEILSFRQKAEQLNASGSGDQAVFYMEHQAR